MPQDSHKRKYKRIDKPFALKMRTKQKTNPDAWNRVIHEWELVVAVNLSAGGVFCYHAFKDLEAGSLVDLKIYLSKTLPPIDCVGKVIRIKKDPISPLDEIAVSFAEMDDQKREMLNKYINNILCE